MKSGIKKLSDECRYFRAYLCKLGRRDTAFSFGFATTPVKAFYLVGENDILLITRDTDLKRVVLNLRGEGAANHEACFVVIWLGR